MILTIILENSLIKGRYSRQIAGVVNANRIYDAITDENIRKVLSLNEKIAL